jgi:hypothetical protein
MATFTEEEVTDFCEILETNSDYLRGHLDYHAALITDSDKTKVLAYVTTWQTGSNSTDTTRIQAMDANFGANINPEDLRNILRKRIAALLHCKHLVGDGMTIQLERG